MFGKLIQVGLENKKKMIKVLTDKFGRSAWLLVFCSAAACLQLECQSV